MSKSELRKKILMQRELMSASTHKLKSSNICTNLISFINQKNINSIGLYYPIKKEPDILSIFEALSCKHQLFFPFIKGDEMEFKKVSSLNELTVGKFSIPSPIETAKTEIPKILLIPSVAVNKSFYRLGMGGGFYDKYLAKNNTPIKCAIVFGEFDNTDFEPDQWDTKMDFVVSEFGVKVFEM